MDILKVQTNVYTTKNYRTKDHFKVSKLKYE